MPPFDDSVGPSGDTSIVPPEDPFLAWYRSQPAAVADDPNEIQMPEADARPPAPTIGFPHDPGPILDQDAAAAAMPPDALANPAVPAETAPPSMAMQPGLGIPSSTLDAAAQAPAPFNMERFGLESPLSHLTPSAPGGNEADQPAPHGQQLTDAEAAKQFAALSPEAQATQAYRWQQAHDQAERERRDHADLEDQQRQLENHGRLQRAQAEALARTKQLDADAQAEAKREIDPKWKAGTGKRIGGIIMGIVGGLVQARSGGPNLGLQLIDQEIDRDIEAQKANKAARLQELSRRGATNQQLLALAGDQYADDEHYRLASYARIQNQIASDMQQFDPKGKTAIQLGGMYTSISQARAKALQDFQDKDFKNRVEALKAASALRKEAAETEKLQLESAKLRGALGGGGTAKPKDIVTRESLIIEGVTDPALLPPPGSVLTRDQWNKRLDSAKKGAEASKAVGEALADAVPDIETADGSPYRAASPAEAAALREKKAAVDGAVGIMDEVLRLREQHGWSSDLLASPEWRQMKQKWGALKLKAKNIEQLGALSGSDIELLDAALGASDPTSVRDPSAGIRSAREGAVQGLNESLTAKRRQGSAAPKRYKPTDLSHATAPAETDLDKARKTAQQRAVNPAEAIAEREGVVYRPKKGLTDVEEAANSVLGLPSSEADRSTSGMTDDVKAAIDAMAEADDIDGLKEAAIHADAPGARAYAMDKVFAASAKQGAKGGKK